MQSWTSTSKEVDSRSPISIAYINLENYRLSRFLPPEVEFDQVEFEQDLLVVTLEYILEAIDEYKNIHKDPNLPRNFDLDDETMRLNILENIYVSMVDYLYTEKDFSTLLYESKIKEGYKSLTPDEYDGYYSFYISHVIEYLYNQFIGYQKDYDYNPDIRQNTLGELKSKSYCFIEPEKGSLNYPFIFQIIKRS